MNLNKKSFIVTFHATLVAKELLQLEEVSEGKNLRSLVEEVLNDVGFSNDQEENFSNPNGAYESEGAIKLFDEGNVLLDNKSPETDLNEEEIDPIDEEHMVYDSVEDSEVQGIGRATEVEPQEEDPENPSTAQGGSLPNQ